jgi:hypothetical protein
MADIRWQMADVGFQISDFRIQISISDIRPETVFRSSYY